MDTKNNRKLRVVIVEDSLVTQRLYETILKSDPDIEVVGFASNGKDGIEAVIQLKPDIVSMDIEMPFMNGLEATREIMKLHPLPVLIVSSLYNSAEGALAMQILDAGALAIIAKPVGPGHPQFMKDSRKYIQMLRTLSEVPVIKRKTLSTHPPELNYRPFEQTAGNQKQDHELIVIGASAGGPDALKKLLGNLKHGLQVPLLVVQHIDPSFNDNYVEWLSSQSRLPIQIADKEILMEKGFVYMPAADKHLVVSRKGYVMSQFDQAQNGNRPSVEKLFETALRHYDMNLVAILLSGMGNDGSEALLQCRMKGAYTIAQSQESCLVFGMPGEAVKLGAAQKILSPVEIANEINTNLTFRL